MPRNKIKKIIIYFQAKSSLNGAFVLKDKKQTNKQKTTNKQKKNQKK